MTTPARRTTAARRAEGFTLIEVMVALTLLLIAAMGVLPLGVLAVKTTENQGHLMAHTTEYAQDKLEQLMALSWGDSTSDTRVFPATELNGSGLTIGGSADPDSPVELYVDYLDRDGTLLASSYSSGQVSIRAADWQAAAADNAQHTLQAAIVDRSGATLIESAPVRFYVKRATASGARR